MDGFNKGISELESKIICFLHKSRIYTASKLQEILVKNNQKKSGDKLLLSASNRIFLTLGVADGMLNGAIIPCPICQENKDLKKTYLRYEYGKYYCPGAWNKKTQKLQKCNFNPKDFNISFRKK